jgi:hypothetical protein
MTAESTDVNASVVQNLYRTFSSGKIEEAANLVTPDFISMSLAGVGMHESTGVKKDSKLLQRI